MRRITVQDLTDLARGAAVLGTGGGGDPLIGRILVEEALNSGHVIDIVTLEELPDDALVVSTAMVGAPTVVVEKAPSGDEAVIALRELEHQLGRSVDAIIPMECGGLNSMIPLLTAARAGLPVIDADGMGRAFPELQMQTFNVAGLPSSPSVVTNEHGHSVVIKTGADNMQLERLARAATVTMGGVAYIAAFPMSGAEVKQAAVRDTLSLAQEIGRVLREARHTHVDPFAALTAHLAKTADRFGTVLATGKVVDVERVIEGGWTIGKVTIETFGTRASVQVHFRNENLHATSDGKTIAIVPDLITIMDAETGAPINTEAVRYGQRVTVYGMATPPIMRSAAALNVFGPRNFGIDEDWIPIEELTQ